MHRRELSVAVSMLSTRTPTLPPATHTNSYGLGARELVLVEPATPYEDEQRRWIEWARALVSAGRRAVAIAVTHHHADHIGGIEPLARELGLPVWGHAETLSRLPEGFVTRTLVDGEAIVLEGPVPTRWEVLHTPGHAPGHLCFFERDTGFIVVGDTIASVGTILIAPGDGHMATYLAQLARLEALGASIALPAHGEPIESPSERFRALIGHRRMREEKVVRSFGAISMAPSTAEDLLPYAYDDISPALFPIALLSLRSHLEKLVEEGRVVVNELGYTIARS